MKTTRNATLTGILLVGVLLVSACTQTYSQTPLGTPSPIPTGLFVSPFPSGQDPLKIIADLGTQTASAMTAEAGGGTVTVAGTPGTPGTETTEEAGTASAEASETEASTTLLPVTVIPGGSTFTPTGQAGTSVVAPTINSTTVAISTPIPVGQVPASYTLQKGEFPYCIARRFDVNPQELLTLNGLTIAQSNLLQPGLVLKLPQTGNDFPPPRALHTHPSTWTVDPGDTFNSIACYYGDLTPDQIAAANNMTASTTLTTGTKLTIP